MTPKTYEIKIGMMRSKLAQWVARAKDGDVVVVMQYQVPVAQLVAYTPGLICDEDEYEPSRPEEPPLYPAYYAADRRHPDAARIIADVLARGDRKLAGKLARAALGMEIEAQRSAEQWPEEEIPVRLVSLEEIERLAPVNEDGVWRRKPDKPDPPSNGGASSALNSGVKKGR